MAASARARSRDIIAGKERGGSYAEEGFIVCLLRDLQYVFL
jgi:hypothetical protein